MMRRTGKILCSSVCIQPLVILMIRWKLIARIVAVHEHGPSVQAINMRNRSLEGLCIFTTRVFALFLRHEKFLTALSLRPWFALGTETAVSTSIPRSTLPANSRYSARRMKLSAALSAGGFRGLKINIEITPGWNDNHCASVCN